MRFLEQIIFLFSSFIISVTPTSSYVEGVVGQPVSFFPHKATNQQDRTVSQLIYRGLFKYDIYGTLKPDLASSWTISSDGLTYTIKIKEGQTWSDGSPVTSDDLIYTAFKSPSLREIATDKIDDLTIRYTLPNKYAPFLSLLTEGVMQTKSEESFSGLTPVSNGEFRVLRIKRSGPIIKEVILYNTNKEANIKKLVFRYYGSEDELETAAKLGEIDAFISSKELSLDNFNKYTFPVQGVYYALFFNLRDEKFSDLMLRQNLRSALDLEKILPAFGILASGPISRSLFTDKEIKSNAFKEDLALNLEQNLVLTIPDTENHEKLANIIKQAWKEKLNIDTQIKKVATDKISKEVIEPRKFEILLYGQEVSRDPDRYAVWHSTQVEYPGLNISGFKQVRADRSLEEGRNVTDNAERFIHYKEFQKVVDEQVPAIFLYHPYVKYYISKSISGFGEKYTFSLKDRFLDFNNLTIL